MTQATLVATLMTPPTDNGKELTALPRSVNWLEVRADLAGDINPDWLRARFHGKLIYTLRSQSEGGCFTGSAEERRQRLVNFGKSFDLVDLEGARDLQPEILDEIAPFRRLISWHGPATDYAALQQRLEAFVQTRARIYKLVPRGSKAGDELPALRLLKDAGRQDLIAYTTGKASFWSRLLAPYFGMPVVFGTIKKQIDPLGEPTISQLIEEYNLPELLPFRELYGIVGDPVQHSLSPRLHNAAYKALGYPALFVPFHAESFRDFWQEVVKEGSLEALGITVKGFTVASPHKESALSEVSITSSMVQRAGSTNLFVRRNGTWKADTTDPEGVVEALNQRRIALAGRKVAVIGCGGSGRAIAAALDQAGAAVTLVNRGSNRGHLASDLLGLPFLPLAKFAARGYSVIVNATPVGRENGDLPFNLRGLSRETMIVDLVYGAKTTPLIAGALALGNPTIDGREVLYLQVRRQFQLMIGQEMPAPLALKILGMTDPTAAFRARTPASG